MEKRFLDKMEDNAACYSTVTMVIYLIY
ncbi:hypothetical protein Goshw_024910 [Gossypium schwendimanii]|uniref:Uncharacterized protein n=1 Tax=Gossypium schwendimanii TaxID=34291 RepID=A0A7J9NBK6_GOSSC|nr:hypothetical protein [Gossypium schwendimanii]